jgi:hypothetical protein
MPDIFKILPGLRRDPYCIFAAEIQVCWFWRVFIFRVVAAGRLGKKPFKSTWLAKVQGRQRHGAGLPNTVNEMR